MMVVGLITWRIARRGRLINSHPSCRRCGFDVVGLAFPTRCPECGVDIASLADVRAGTFGTRPVLRAIGIAVLLIGVAGTGYFGVVALRHAVGVSDLPTWVLVQLADGRLARDDPRAIEELVRRMYASEISPSTRADLIQRALRVQSDPLRSWQPGWGQLLMYAHSVKALTEADRAKFVAGAVDTRVIARPVVRSQGKLTLQFVGVPLRAFARGEALAMFTDLSVSLQSAGNAIAPIDLHAAPQYRFCAVFELTPVTRGLLAPATVSSSSQQSYSLDLPALEPGEYIVRVQARVGVELSEDLEGARSRVLPVQSVDAPLLRRDWDIPVRVVPPETMIVHLIQDPQAASELGDRLGILVMRSYPRLEDGTTSRDHAFLSVRIQYPNMRTNAYLTCRMTSPEEPSAPPLEHDALWLDARNFVGGENTYDLGSRWGKRKGVFNAKTVDIELRSDPFGAETVIGNDSILGLRIRFKDVPVWDTDTPQPPYSKPHSVETFNTMPPP